MMVKFVAAAAAFSAASAVFAGETPNSNPDRLPGLWQQVDESSQRVQALVRISRQADGTYTGVVEKIIPGPGEDADPKCDLCSGERRGKPVLGMRIIEGLRRAANNLYEAGQILDPDDGTVYRLKITVIEGGAKLDVHGYVGISLFGRSQQWPRALADR